MVEAVVLTSSPARVAGRYLLESKLGEGAMGVVWRVRDEATGRTLALKQLRSTVGRFGEALFRREYHTLVLLKHPRIIEVFDYGVDAAGPFYTMELLDGADLRRLSPMDYREACRHLRDIASSLALLAAHRLVHRDITAANVRVTSEGRCKVIDFGALSPFGMSDAVVGTPPYVPPEAVRGFALDQRSDLFALGALAYFMLTGTHAFPSRELKELERAWTKRPERPSVRAGRLAAEGATIGAIPPELDDLVLSLLGLDPAARPQSAAEAIERFVAAAGLEPDASAPAAESYLSSASLVGRGAELDRARALLSRAGSGAGGALCIRHPPGGGGTRLLAEIALEARLAGAVPLHADGELRRGTHAVARALGERLIAAVPDAKAELPPELTDAGWFRAGKTDRPSDRASSTDNTSAPLAARLRVLSALEDWFFRAARLRPIVILVDNAHAADELSATLLALLADAAPEHPLAVIVSSRTGEAVTAAGPLERLSRSAATVELAPLSTEDTQALVQSLFGAVPNSSRLTHWLHGLSNGNPMELMDLCQLLVAQRVARYVDGTWLLPLEPPDLKSWNGEAGDAVFAKLPEEARRLAGALAVHGGHLSLEGCLALAEAQKVEAFGALDALTSSGVLTGHEGGYRFTHDTTRMRLLSRLSPEEKQRLHLAVANHMLATGDPEVVTSPDVGWHLLSGGDERRGAEILGRAGQQLMKSDDLPDAIPALEAAVAVYRKLDRPRNELCSLVHHLAFAGFYVDRRLADEYGDEALQLLAEETGLALTAKVRPFVGVHIALVIGLVYALVLHQFNGRGGIQGLSRLITILGGLIAALVGGAVICLDPERAERYASVIAPFRPLGLWHGGAFCHALSSALVGVTKDHHSETARELRGLLARLDGPRSVVGFPAEMHPLTRGGLLYAIGAIESFRDDPACLDRAKELEACGLRLYDMVACQIRANYYHCQGNDDLARRFERSVDLHATRNGSTWQAEVWVPSGRLVACRRTRDVLGLKLAADELERLSQEIPSLERYARMARATLEALRGEYETAIPMLERLHTEVEPRGFIGWTLISAGLAEAYSATGQHERAADLCRRVVAVLDPEDRAFASLTIDIELALARAEALGGHTHEARHRLETLLRVHEKNDSAITLGAIHRASADVANLAGDREGAQHHRARMVSYYRATNHPSLIAECERLNASAMPLVGLEPGGEAVTVIERI